MNKSGADSILEKIAYCETHGHRWDKKSERLSSGSGGPIIDGTCSRCGSYYERGLNPEELIQFNYRMNVPFTI
jgi:hypothetical protein